MRRRARLKQIRPKIRTAALLPSAPVPHRLAAFRAALRSFPNRSGSYDLEHSLRTLVVLSNSPPFFASMCTPASDFSVKTGYLCVGRRRNVESTTLDGAAGPPLTARGKIATLPTLHWQAVEL